MNRRWRIAALVVGLAGVAAAAGAITHYLLEPRAPATAETVTAEQLGGPDTPVNFTLPDLAGTAHRLSEWRGKVVLINFWATWCEPCRDEIPLLSKLQREYRSQGLQIVGIATDEPENAPVHEFAARAGVNYPILSGDGRASAVARRMGVDLIGLPFSILIDRSGRVVTSHAGALTSEQAGRLLQPALGAPKPKSHR